MDQPQTYAMALSLMITSMVAWGSWANTVKMAPNYSFELFYWDYAIGVLAITLILGFTFGSAAGGSTAFSAQLTHAGMHNVLFGIAGGIVFNVANLLLVAAIRLAGLAVAFPVGIGLALVVGVILNYAIEPHGNALLLFGGVAAVLAAIVVDARAHQLRRLEHENGRLGLKLALGCGVLMGSFYPLVVKAQTGTAALGPYTVAFVFALGLLISTAPANVLIMRKLIPNEGGSGFADYRSASAADHAWGGLGGMIWGVGLICSLVAGAAALVGPAISYAIGQGATMISAAWGVFVWREFQTAPSTSKRLLPVMFALFLIGLAMIAIAPLVGA